MLIRVNKAPVVHRNSEFCAWEPGIYEFSDEPAYSGWLQGQIEQGNVSLAESAATDLDGNPVDLGAGPPAMILPEGVTLPTLPLLTGDEPAELGIAIGQPEVNDPADIRPAIKCTGAKKDGSPCGSWALEGSDRCRMHPHE